MSSIVRRTAVLAIAGCMLGALACLIAVAFVVFQIPSAGWIRTSSPALVSTLAAALIVAALGISYLVRRSDDELTLSNPELSTLTFTPRPRVHRSVQLPSRTSRSLI